MQNSQVIKEAMLKRVESLFGKNFAPGLVDLGEAVAMVKKEDGLCLDVKFLFVINILHNSPFFGSLKLGDNIMAINGQLITDAAKIMKVLPPFFAKTQVARVTVTYFRLKYRLPRPLNFPPIQKQENYTYETAVLYNIKGAFHFGLDVRDVDNKILVCHTVESSLSELIFPLGAAIIDVDGERMTNCAAFRERFNKSLEIRNYALILLEIPATDPLKNMWRAKIASTTKDTIRTYALPNDVKNYMLHGIKVLNSVATEPKSGFAEDNKGVKSPSTGGLKIDERVKEVDVPSAWNSCLFVKLPPAKTVETEGGD